MRSSILLVVVIVACAGGDSDDASSSRQPASAPIADSSATFRTDAESYVLSYDGGIMLSADIPFSFRNPLPDTVYVVNCNGNLNVALERPESGGWTTYWSPIRTLCLSAPIVILPGATYQDTARIVGALPGYNTVPELSDPEGTYRLRWGSLVLHYGEYAADRGFGDPLPEELTASNEFRLRDPRSSP